MSQIHVRKMVESRIEYAGRNWWYNYRAIPSRCDELQVSKFSASVLEKAAHLTKAWNNQLNSEWLTRIFFSVKMVLGASVSAQSLGYASEKNLRPVVPYLEYYTVLHSLRAVVLTDPTVSWNDGEILKMTHKKTANLGTAILARIDGDLAKEIKQQTINLRLFRELISYRAPSSGDNFKRQDCDVLETSRLLLEVAQFQSELIEASVLKNATGTYALQAEWMRQACCHDVDGEMVLDQEDWYRLDYFRRKYPLPTNICQMMSEGHVEDFFGSWCPEEGNDGEGLFNPDENWRIIFDVP